MTDAKPIVPLDQRPKSGPYSDLTPRSAKRFIVQQLSDAGLPFADEDALDLVLGLTGLTRTDYTVRGTEVLTTEQVSSLREATDRRLSGEPVDRILGYRDFYGRRFAIDNVLSPRGDTEVLLIATLQALKARDRAQILELGTGSGALAVTLACERPDLEIVATDVSPDAITTAKANAVAHHVTERITFFRSDWFGALDERRFDAILSNPPYIDAQAMTELPPEVAAFDPALALAGGDDGLDAYRQIISDAVRHLTPGGWLGFEIGFDQARAVSDLLKAAGFERVIVRADPAGLDRTVEGWWPQVCET